MKASKFILCIFFLSLPALVSTQSIGIIGTATPIGNWSADTNMVRDTVNPNLWTLVVTLSEGELKFRQDDSWILNWGGNTFPFGTGILGGPNIHVTAGYYVVSFNTHTLLYNFDTITSGNLGIGTLTPTEKLDVNGNIKFSGELKPGGMEGAQGQLLQSNGDGTMKWIDRSDMQGSVGYGTWGECEMTNISEYNPITDPDGLPNDYFGWSVSISGDYVIVGAYKDDDAEGTDQGSAIVFHYNSGTGLWEKDGDKLFNNQPHANDWFGYSVGISGDYAIVGAPHDDRPPGSNQGAVVFFERNPSSGIWELYGHKIRNPLSASEDNFGYSVAIDGEYAIVGAPTDDGDAGIDQGSASIFKRNESAGAWILQGSKIIAPDSAAGDLFGYSVAISGDYAIVGAPYDDHDIGSDQGSACIYKRNGSTWELQGSKFYNYLSAGGDLFGMAVGISGDYAIVGAPGDNEGDGTQQGSVSIYRRNESTGAWEWHGAKLTNSDAFSWQFFGRSVSISGDFTIVGTPDETLAGCANQGSSSIFINIGPTWRRYQKITDPAGSQQDHFGCACAIEGSTRRFVIGSYSTTNYMGKVVFGKY